MGVIISEGTAISPNANGYPSAPGIYTAEQIAGWRVITDAVHARGGRIIVINWINGHRHDGSGNPETPAVVALDLCD
ncbi:MAG TPA: hypothetical protein VN957_20785 [Chthoniobacterales bacterium]|nr:hypothetical protein [Chthoniobacterales bacterium]